MNDVKFRSITGMLGKMTPSQLEILRTKIAALAYRRYREDDSPKGENIPGVRYR